MPPRPPKDKRTYVGELEWVLARINDEITSFDQACDEINIDPKNNHACLNLDIIRKALDFASEVSRMRGSSGPIPKRPSLRN